MALTLYEKKQNMTSFVDWLGTHHTITWSSIHNKGNIIWIDGSILEVDIDPKEPNEMLNIVMDMIDKHIHEQQYMVDVRYAGALTPYTEVK